MSDELQVGTTVTIHVDVNTQRNDWASHALKNRRMAGLGVVEQVIRGHGMCYRVRHADGTLGFYDPFELTALPEQGGKAPIVMTDEEFHKLRRMWALTLSGTVMVADLGDQRTHFEWFKELLGNNAEMAIDQWTRGYVLIDLLVAYKGQNFSHRVNHEMMPLVLMAMDGMHPIPIAAIGLGVTAGPTQPWPPKELMSLGEYERRLAKAQQFKVALSG